MGLQGHPDVFSVSNSFEGSCNGEGTGAQNAIFEGKYKFSDSEARKNYDSTDLAVQREQDRSASPSTQEHQKLEDKLKQNSTEERSGRNNGAIGEIGEQIQKRAALRNC